LGLMVSELHFCSFLDCWGVSLSMIYLFISHKFQGLDLSFPTFFLLRRTHKTIFFSYSEEPLPMKTLKGQQTSRILVAPWYYSSISKGRKEISATCWGIFGIIWRVLKRLFNDWSLNPVWEPLVWNLPMNVYILLCNKHRHYKRSVSNRFCLF
jgi:hypothetical protein